PHAPTRAPRNIPVVNDISRGADIHAYDQWSVRVDHQFGQKDSFYVRFTDSRNPQSSIGLPTLSSGLTDNFMNLAVSDTHTISPTSLVTIRFGLQRTNPEYFSGGPDVLKEANLTGFAP